MSLNTLATVSSYPDMLLKIATATFFISLANIQILRWQIPEIEALLSMLHLDIPIPSLGILIPAGTAIPALVIAVISRMIKLHDKISDLFKIREDFDIHYILMPLALGVGATITGNKIERLSANRRTLMNQAFYEYASVTRKDQVINTHYITMAMDQWKWYWVLLEGTVITFLTAIVLLFFNSYLFAAILFLIVLLALGLLQVTKRPCIHHAQGEVEQILSDYDRRKKISEVFNAL